MKTCIPLAVSMLLSFATLAACDRGPAAELKEFPTPISLHEYGHPDGIAHHDSAGNHALSNTPSVGAVFLEASGVSKGIQMTEATQAMENLVVSAENDGVPGYLAEQAVAEAFARELMSRDGELGESGLEVLGVQIETLLTNGFAGTALLEQSLDRLFGQHWDSARVDAASRLAIEAYDAYIERLASCPECDPARGFHSLRPDMRDEYLAAIERYRADQAAAAERLRSRLDQVAR